MNLIRNELRVSRHRDAILYFNQLLIDLKLIELGHKITEEINMKRLEEGNKHIRDIGACAEPIIRR